VTAENDGVLISDNDVHFDHLAKQVTKSFYTGGMVAIDGAHSDDFPFY